MDVGALSYGSSLTRIGQTGRSGASDVAPKATDAKEQAAGASPAQSPGLYISPVLRYDQSARVAVLLFRDFDTGETRDQIPAERVVEQYRRSGGRQQSAGDQQSTEAAEATLLGERPAGSGGAEASSSGYSSGGGSAVATTGLGASLLAAAAPSGQASGTSAAGTPTAGSPTAGSLMSFSV